MYSDVKVFSACFESKNDGNDQSRQRLISSLSDFRKRVGELVETIPRDIPGLTVHNLTHMDALWKMLDILTDGSYPLNPAEAYVLGGAILLHDSAMTISAYPGGLKELKDTAHYKDALAYFEMNSQMNKMSPEFIKISEGYAISDTLRLTHAENAEKLATMKWYSKINEAPCYLIDDSELREHFAHSIGLIAHSHHWDSDKVTKKLSHCKGAFTGFPAEWSVNEVKLALILRCVDAMHLDDRRAPTFTSTLRDMNEVSENHWRFQNKLAQPTLVNRKLQYTSKSPFTVDEAGAWNLCFDTLQMVDQELRDSSDIHERYSIPPFEAQGVVGSGSPDALALHVQVKDWTPIPLSLQVSDVPSLALTLGGKDLYNYSLTPVREMIQNAADAIEARAIVDEDFETEDGLITIKLTRGDKPRLEITDNGVGMSERVLTKVLLDFGMSFWKSNAARTEFPGIQKYTSRFRGRYGIGFFSVFMWSNDVTVSSRRYEDGRNSSLTLDFSNGMQSRPLLREAISTERSSTWTTKIGLELNQTACKHLFSNNNSSSEKAKKQILIRSFKNLCGILGIKVILEYEDEKVPVSLPDWKTCSADEFVNFYNGIAFRFSPEHAMYKDTLSHVVCDGEVVGRCLVDPYHHSAGTSLPIYDKGIYVKDSLEEGFFGVLEAKTTNAARDKVSELSAFKDTEWIAELRDSAFEISRNLGEKVYLQNLFIPYNLMSDDEPYFVSNREILSFNQLKQNIKSMQRFSVKLDYNDDDLYSRAHSLHWKSDEALNSMIELKIDESLIYPLEIDMFDFSGGFSPVELIEELGEDAAHDKFLELLDSKEGYFSLFWQLCRSCEPNLTLTGVKKYDKSFGGSSFTITFSETLDS